MKLIQLLVETGSAPLEFISHNRSDDGESRDKASTGRISLEQRTNYLMHCSIAFPILPLKYGWRFYFRGKKSHWRIQGSAIDARPLSVQFLSFSCSPLTQSGKSWIRHWEWNIRQNIPGYNTHKRAFTAFIGLVDPEIGDGAGGWSTIHRGGGCQPSRQGR